MKRPILILLFIFLTGALCAQDRIHTDYGEILQGTVTKLDGKSVKFFHGNDPAVIPAGRVSEIEFSDGGKFIFQDGVPTVVNPGHFGARLNSLTAEGLVPVSDDLLWKWIDKDTHFAALQSGRAASRFGLWGIRTGAAASVAGAIMMSILSKKEDTVTIETTDPSGVQNTVTIASYRDFSLSGNALLFSGLGILLDGIGWTVAGAKTLNRVADQADHTARGNELTALRRDIAAVARRDRIVGIAGIAGGAALLGTGVWLFEKNNRKTYYTVRINDTLLPTADGKWETLGWGEVSRQDKPYDHLVSIPFFLVGAAALHAGVGFLNQGLTRSQALKANGFGLAWQF